MNRSQAEELRGRMCAEHPDRATHSFILSECDGVWTVAKVALPPGPGNAARATAPDTRGRPHDDDGAGLPGGVPRAAGF